MSIRSQLCAAALPLALGLLSPFAYAQQAITTPIFGLPTSNFRDIAGVAKQFSGSGYSYTTTKDGSMRTGVFYRSNSLANMTPNDQAIINKLGISLDIDLRTPSEIAAGPDIVPLGAAYENINVIGSQGTQFAPETAAQTIAYMQQTNVSFVSVDHERAAIGKVLLDMAHADGAVLFHCTAGKDRTGWVTAVLDNIAGMSSSDIMANYLATNAYSASLINLELQQYTAKYGAEYASIVAAAMGVQSSFLTAGLNQVASQYGSMYNYLTQGLGLTQADIYVLRAKMVYYATLPGEAGLQGNAAAGANFLRNLQNSPLSGKYTAFNYYLQSAIDAGSLNGEQTTVGGQVYADTASTLVRSALQTNQTIMPYIEGIDLRPGTAHVWATTIGSYVTNQASTGNANDVERMVGGIMGVTYRANTHVAFNGGIGYGTGSISSAGAGNTLDTYTVTAGTRYGFSSLNSGYFVSVQASYEYSDDRTRRSLGNGLGVASGRTHANTISGDVAFGDRLQVSHMVLSPQIGVYAAHLVLNGFTETGSELALSEAQLKHTLTALTVLVPLQLPTTQYQSWTFAPTLTASYARILGSPAIRTTGALDGYSISQYSAFNNPNLIGLGVAVTAAKGSWSVQANGGSQFTTNGGTGFNGHLSVNYKF